jgi:membrane-bound lytic murein transglycosylase A
VALTAGVSLAADPRFIPPGAPLLLATTDPTTGTALVRPMLVQDTGTAIRGALRFDLFWGYGIEAADRAGRQRHDGAAWVFTPKGVAPGSLLGR